MRRYELSDAQWARIEPLLPDRFHDGEAGHPFHDHRPLVNAILWILHSGAPWRDLPERYRPWEAAYGRFNTWREDGSWNRIVTSLLDQLDDQGRIDHDLWCIDGSALASPRTRSSPGGHETGCTRK